MSNVDRAFIENMITLGEFAPAARDIGPHDAMIQWVNATSADEVRVNMRPPLAPWFGTVDHSPRRPMYVDSVGVGNGLRATVVTADADMTDPWMDEPSRVHPHIMSVQHAN